MFTRKLSVSQKTEKILRPLSAVIVTVGFVFWGMTGTGCRTHMRVSESGIEPPRLIDTDESYRITASELSVSEVEIAFDEATARTVSGIETDSEWEVMVEEIVHEEIESLYRITLQRQAHDARHTVEYLCRREENPDDDQASPLTPLMATEEVYNEIGDHLLLRRQTIDVRVAPTGSGEEWTTDKEAAVKWAIANRDRLYSPEVIDVCSDYIWHNAGLDNPPGSFNEIINLMLRRIELDPQVIDPYATTAWLLWSKWVTWKDDPEQMPDGKTGVDRAVRLLEQGRMANPDNASYHFETAATVMPLARFHREDLYDFVIANLKRAHSLAESDDFKARIGKFLAHNYRHADQPEAALEWYEKAVSLDPEDEISKKNIEQLKSDNDN